MAVPTIDELYDTVIQTMSDGKIHCTDKIKLDVASALKLNAASLAELMPDKRRTVFEYRVEEVLDKLVGRGDCMEAVSPDHYRLTH